jgi:nucleotide-binding universal stress UspA family protein
MLPIHDNVGYIKALQDFNAARQRATLQAIYSKLTGKSVGLLQYDEVRKRLGGIESARKVLKEIPIDSIVGTVSRYNDFTRTLLPLRENDARRWAQVKLANEDSSGLPPIDVYQIGDAYFIFDGHHRASVAKDLGAKYIQAYVREVFTKVPISPVDQPDDIILKSEYADFLNQTHLDDLRPGSDLRVTVPGEYIKLLEHISVHRYFQGIDEKREIPYTEAVQHWYDKVYSPVAKIILQRNILRDFPGRTETDMYLWIMDHRYFLEQDLGTKVTANAAVTDLIRFSPSIKHSFRRSIEKLVDVLTPDEFDPGPLPGEWRRQHRETLDQGLFNNILVAIPGDEAGWQSMDMALRIAQKENAFLGGLYVMRESHQTARSDQAQSIRTNYQERCVKHQIQGNLVVETGDVTRKIYERSFWADLVVLRMLYPPPLLSLHRIRSGLRTLIRICPSPLLIFPPNGPVEIKKILLAYGGHAKADEALFVATYMAKRWNVHLTVITVDRGRPGDEKLADRARNYLEDNEVNNVCFVFEKDTPAKAILSQSETLNSDLILMGGYESGLIGELIFGSTVDRVLWGTHRPVLICH